MANEAAVAAAKAEYARWSTASDTRRPHEAVDQVVRRADDGTWVETSAHPFGEAERPMHEQALAAAVEAALKAAG